MKQRVQAHRARADHEDLGLAVQLRDAGRVAAQELRREVAQRADDARLDELDLAHEVLRAVLDLPRQRVAVAGRPAAQDVGDEDIGAREPDLSEQLVEQLAGGAHERDSLLVLLRARRLPDEHEVGVGVAGSEDDLRAGARELGAARTDPRLAEDRGELGAALLPGGHNAMVERIAVRTGLAGLTSYP